MLFLIFSFALVMVLPIRWAATFTNGQNTGFISCALASVVAPVLAIAAFRLSSGGFNGFVLGYLALLASYVAIIRIPAASIVGFAIVVLALQIAAVMALVSFGLNISKLLLGHP